MTQASGLHHVTLITRRVQDNVDFYAGFLGLRLVKRTAGFEDTDQLHLFYGDALGSPGALVTFLVWEDGAAGRTGLGQVAEIALAVPPAAIGGWLTRALARGVPVTGPAREFGEPVLRLKDPDGIIVKLVGTDLPAAAPLADPDAPRRLRAVTLLTDRPADTAAFLTRFGYRPGPAEGAIRRMLSPTDAVDVRDAAGYVPGIPGTGTADHVAFRAADIAALAAAEADLARTAAPTQRHDRTYFTSLYVREPGGTLLELATDAPGFTVDEPAATLGQALFLPGATPAAAADLRLRLPQFALPGAPRPPRRALPFIHRLHQPDDPDGTTLLLFHGTGGAEADLMPLAHRIAPRATLLGLRGRSTEEGRLRWFRHAPGGGFDQADIAAEAAALAAFVAGAVRGYGLDPARLTGLGYSNGANFLAAALALHPGLLPRAVLLRAIPVLAPLPRPDLGGTQLLLLAGAQDPAAPQSAGLARWLADCGARVDTATLPADHALGPDDAARAAAWLAPT